MTCLDFPRSASGIALVAWGIVVAIGPKTLAQPLSAQPSPDYLGQAVPPAPADLPQYELALELDPDKHRARLRMRAQWINTTSQPQHCLVFNFYPHYRVPPGDYIHLAKTLEMLRLQPSLGVDRCGRFGVVHSVRLLEINGQTLEQVLPFAADSQNSTAIYVSLPQAVLPRQAVRVELDCAYYLPNKQGRIGQWKGVTYLTNSLPVLAYCDDSGWKPMPFVPWHQPWYNEAGIYRATVTLPANLVLAVPAAVERRELLVDGRQRCILRPFIGRDFAVLCSSRYREYTAETTLRSGRKIQLRCYAFPEHEYYALEMLKIAAEAIPIYSLWFGDYPYDHFTIAESYFGWNGNECAGLIMIDERVFNMPRLARGYVEYLVSHETCHQWWYNMVGTNGYAEPFLDEGAAVHFTHRLMDWKHGRNNPLLNWPPGWQWLPNIHRDNYRNSGVYTAIRNGEMQPAAQPLPEYKSLFGLFTGAYDRGSKVFGMIETQLGDAAFLDFTRQLVAKYRWRVLHISDFQHELETYTGRSWQTFFKEWVYGKGLTDWAIEEVNYDSDRPRVWKMSPHCLHRLQVTVRQQGEISAPTTLAIDLTNGDVIRLPLGLGPTPLFLPEYRAVIQELEDGRWRVDLPVSAKVKQIVVDPDKVLLDANPRNNIWPGSPRRRYTPLYTILDETNLTTDYDRWNFTFGPWLWGPAYHDPWYTRTSMTGLRAGGYLVERAQTGTYLTYRTDYQDLVLGADAVVKGDHWEAGGNWEWRIAGPWGRLRNRTVWPWDRLDGAGGPHRGVIYLRQVLQPTSSLYLPPMMYQEVYTTYQDNFLPRSRSSLGQRWDRTVLGGYHYRLNLYTPYWDPETGVWVDLVAAAGGVVLNGWKETVQGRVELAAVRAFPEQWGIVRHVRVAARITAMAAWPDYGQFFALGGGTLFRGYDLAERQGSLLWTGNVELRWPLVREVNWDILDHVFGARNIWLATFYDVGAIYVNGRQISQVAHALGVGVRVDVAVFSFIERAVLRLDVAKTVNDATPWQIWFGLQHAF